MAIQIPNPGTGNGATGDNEFVLWTKVKDNFSDQTNAAGRLVGTGAEQVPLSKNIPSLLGTAATKDVGEEEGNVLERGAFGLGGIGTASVTIDDTNIGTVRNSFCSISRSIGGGGLLPSAGYNYSGILRRTAGGGTALAFPYPHSSVVNSMGYYFVTFDTAGAALQAAKIYTDKNTSIVNGSLKPSSPVVKIHTDSLELNDDAERMGVTLNKRGVGDYLLQNTTGMRSDGGWSIELPQDVNGNPYFAVAYNELENNDIEVKTYKRIFDMNTFMFVPDLDSPVDIKEGSSIAIRFNDLPLGDIQPEV